MMDYDIFISYAHHDNDTHEQWVQAFHDRLGADFRSRAGKKLNLFFDREGLNTGNVLSERLQGALKASAIFIPILSPAYLSSSWCRREFLHFLQQAGNRLIVDGSSRIVPVQLMPYDRYEAESNEDQTQLRTITGFLSEKEILYKNFYRHPLPIRPEEPAFDNCIAELSDDIFPLLKSVREALKEPDAPAAPKQKAIFLAAAAGEAKTLREGLLKELQQQRKHHKIAHQVLPDNAPDAPADPRILSAAEFEAFARRQLEAAEFSVHLFDDVEGPKTPDTREPITHLEYRLARELSTQKADFRVYAAWKITEDCATSQEQFIKRLEQDARANPQIEILPAFEGKAVKDFLLETIQLRADKAEQQKNAPPPNAPRRVFFIHDHRDKDDPVRNRLDDLIYQQQFDVYTPVFREDDPHEDPDTSFRNFWLVCNKAVVLLRNASTAWCNAMKVELIKTATEKNPPFEMAICVADPDADKRKREVRSHEFQIIDCSRQDFEQQIIQFLQDQRHA